MLMKDVKKLKTVMHLLVPSVRSFFKKNQNIHREEKLMNKDFSIKISIAKKKKIGVVTVLLNI